MSTQNTSNTSPDWNKLNEDFLQRRDSVNRFNIGLEEKVRKAMSSEETWSKLLNKHSRFQASANAYFNEWLETLATLSNDEELLKMGGIPNQKEEIFNNLKVEFTEWNSNASAELKNLATITIESLLLFKPYNFTIVISFLVETNPITFKQEFRLKAFGGDGDQLTYEREKSTLLLNSIMSDEGWAEIGYSAVVNAPNNILRIEKEIYSVINHFIYGGGTRTYRNVDFPALK